MARVRERARSARTDGNLGVKWELNDHDDASVASNHITSIIIGDNKCHT